MALAEDRRNVGIRLSVLQVLVALLFSVLAVSFWVLQVAQHDTYAELAENNNQRTLALRAPRGVLFDRTGKVLVENRHSFNISIVREHTRCDQQDLGQRAPGYLHRRPARLGHCGGCIRGDEITSRLPL